MGAEKRVCPQESGEDSDPQRRGQDITLGGVWGAGAGEQHGGPPTGVLCLRPVPPGRSCVLSAFVLILTVLFISSPLS